MIMNSMIIKRSDNPLDESCFKRKLDFISYDALQKKFFPRNTFLDLMLGKHIFCHGVLHGVNPSLKYFYPLPQLLKNTPIENKTNSYKSKTQIENIYIEN